MGINRNIVECKVETGGHNSVWCLGINRNIVECKERTVKTGILLLHVLIETLWNVKSVYNSCSD